MCLGLRMDGGRRERGTSLILSLVCIVVRTIIVACFFHLAFVMLSFRLFNSLHFNIFYSDFLRFNSFSYDTISSTACTYTHLSGHASAFAYLLTILATYIMFIRVQAI